MPKEYPPSSTVYYYFSKWRNDGSWKRINDRLVEWVRVAEDRDHNAGINILNSGLGTVGHTGTFALDASNASGDIPSTLTGANLCGQGASLREESPA